MYIRSFALNAEVNLVVYDPVLVRALREVQQRYFLNSQKLSAELWQQRPLVQKVLQNTARLADSLLLEASCSGRIKTNRSV